MKSDFDWLNYLSDWKLYIPFYISFFRYGVFFFLRVIPSIFYKQYKTRNVMKLDKDSKMKVTVKDVTVIVTAYQPNMEDFLYTLENIIKQKPYEVIIAADKSCFKDPDFESDCTLLETKHTKVNVIKINEPGKRPALAAGIKKTTTKLVVLADDDVKWSKQFLGKLIAPFQHSDKIGGVGCKQIGRYAHFFDVFRVLADMRLAVRYLELMATTTLDKGASCISGRTGAYRTEIIQNEKFYDYFLNEKFFGMQLQSGDDKCLTRFVMNEGYDVYHQLRDSCRLSTSFKNGRDFIRQLLRWSRNTWRSDIKSVFIERKSWRRHPFTLYFMFDKMITPFFLLFGLFFVTITILVNGKYYAFVPWAIWLFVTRCIKLSYYLVHKPIFILYIPVFILFQFFTAFLRIYTLFTTYERGWLTRDISVVGNTIVRTDEIGKNTDDVHVDVVEKNTVSIYHPNDNISVNV